MVFQLSAIRRAMTWRKGESGFLVTGPHLEKSIGSGAGLGAGAAAARRPGCRPRAAAAAGCRRARPPARSGPAALPRTRVRSMPRSRASLRIEGARRAPRVRPPLFWGLPLLASVLLVRRGVCTTRWRLSPAPARPWRPPGGRRPGSLNERMRWPTLNLSPALTKTLVTVPAALDGIVATAFSFSSSRIGWSLVTGRLP